MTANSFPKFEFFALTSLKVCSVAFLTIITQALCVRLTKSSVASSLDVPIFWVNFIAIQGAVGIGILLISFILVCRVRRKNDVMAKWIWLVFWFFIFLPYVCVTVLAPLLVALSFMADIAFASMTSHILGAIGVGLLLIGLTLQLISIYWLFSSKDN